MCFFYTCFVVHARMIPLRRFPESLADAVRGCPTELGGYVCRIGTQRLREAGDLGRLPQPACRHADQADGTREESRLYVQRMSDSCHELGRGQILSIAHEVCTAGGLRFLQA